MINRVHYRRTTGSQPRREIPYRQPRWSPAPGAAQRLVVTGPAAAPDPQSFVELVLALRATQADLCLEVAATARSVSVSVACERWRAPEVERAIRGAAPQCEVEPGPAVLLPDGPLQLAAALARPGRPDWAPLRDARAFGGADPLASILEAAQPLGDAEGLLIRLRARPASPRRRARAQRELTRPARGRTFLEVLFDTVPPEPRFEPRTQRPLEERLAQPGFEVCGVAILAGSEQARLISRARSLSATFGGCFDSGFGGLTFGPWRWGTELDASILAGASDTRLYLSAGELAALWHVPSERVNVPGLGRTRRPSVPLPPQVASMHGLVLGVHRERGRHFSVHLPRPDLEFGHMAVLGRTGVGKSTLAHGLLAQLLLASDRPGIGVVDPHGSLVQDIALRSIPPHREPDVAFLELGDADYPIGLSLFAPPRGVSRDVHVQATFSILRLIFREHWSPTRMEDAVFALTATLCRVPGATLLDVSHLFGDPIYRRRALAPLDDPVALDFWADYEQLSDAARREIVRPILYRLRAFSRTPAVRNIVCQARGLDFADLLERGGILLVSLAGSAIQAEADLLGELVIARLHLAALGRLDRPGQSCKPFYLAVDESQRFAGASLPILLSEGRKLGLPLILCTQYLDAWGEPLAQAVLGNVGTLVAFRCGPSDARRLAGALRPFTPDDLEDLDRHAAVAKLQLGGATVPAFDFRTLPVNGVADGQRLARIRAATRQRYARPRAEVETELHAARAQVTTQWEGIDVDEE